MKTISKATPLVAFALATFIGVVPAMPAICPLPSFFPKTSSLLFLYNPNPLASSLTKSSESLDLTIQSPQSTISIHASEIETNVACIQHTILKTTSLPESQAELSQSQHDQIIFIDQNRPLIFLCETLPLRITARLNPSDQEPFIVVTTFRPAIQKTTNGIQYVPHLWHYLDGSIYLHEYGDYYFVTNKANFKILLLPSQNTLLQNAIMLLDFYCKNTQIGLRDRGRSGADVMKMLFYSSLSPAYICGESTETFNYLVRTVFGIPARHCQFYGSLKKKQQFFGHSVSELKIDGQWIFFDSLFNVMAEKDNKYLSLFEVYDLISQRSLLTFRHTIPKDTVVPRRIPKHPFKQYYLPEQIQHIMIDGYIVPKMQSGVDYSYLNGQYNYTCANYISQREFLEKFYLKDSDK